jgi:hypothetical protein
MIKEVTWGIPKLEVDMFGGLLIDYVRASGLWPLSKACGPLPISNTSFRGVDQ